MAGKKSVVRARDLGIPLAGTPGEHNGITDVPGVEVGMVTLRNPDVKACTGVTMILPRGKNKVGTPVAAASHSFNGNGEMTGRAWVDEAGQTQMPIAITNSHSVGMVHSGVDRWTAKNRPDVSTAWMLPVVAETWDGYLNDINGQHVTTDHVEQALDSASNGPVEEGSVGGGTGMNAYGFKGGTGTASRKVEIAGTTYTVGGLVQANFGDRDEFTVKGVPLGERSAADCPIERSGWFGPELNKHRVAAGAGSVIVILGTDAPLLPQQLKAMARRVSIGLGRTGTAGGHFSGDIFLAFSTANEGALRSMMPADPQGITSDSMEFVPWGRIDPLYTAVVEIVEEAVLNSMINNETVEGRDGHISYALPHEEVSATDFSHAQ